MLVCFITNSYHWRSADSDAHLGGSASVHHCSPPSSPFRHRSSLRNILRFYADRSSPPFPTYLCALPSMPSRRGIPSVSSQPCFPSTESPIHSTCANLNSRHLCYTSCTVCLLHTHRRPSGRSTSVWELVGPSRCTCSPSMSSFTLDSSVHLSNMTTSMNLASFTLTDVEFPSRLSSTPMSRTTSCKGPRVEGA